MTILKQAKKVTLRGTNEDVDKVSIEALKTFHNAGGKPARGFSLTIQHKTFSALNCTQDFGNRVKQSLKRNTNSNSRKVELSHVKYFDAFVSTLNMSLPSVQTKTKEDEIGMVVDQKENFRPQCLTTSLRSESSQDKSGSLPTASWDYVMLFAIFLKS